MFASPAKFDGCIQHPREAGPQACELGRLCFDDAGQFAIQFHIGGESVRACIEPGIDGTQTLVAQPDLTGSAHIPVDDPGPGCRHIDRERFRRLDLQRRIKTEPARELVVQQGGIDPFSNDRNPARQTVGKVDSTRTGDFSVERIDSVGVDCDALEVDQRLQPHRRLGPAFELRYRVAREASRAKITADIEISRIDVRWRFTRQADALPVSGSGQ